MKKALVSPPGLRWTLGTSKDESESYFVKIIKIFNRILRDILMQSIIGVILFTMDCTLHNECLSAKKFCF